MKYINNDISVRFPDVIRVQEFKAPADESIKLMEEVHQKVMDNIVSKVKVDDNLISGKCICIKSVHNPNNEFSVYFKFKINGKEFTVTKDINYYDLDNLDREKVLSFEKMLKDNANSIMLWYALKEFAKDSFEKITGNKVPDYI